MNIFVICSVRDADDEVRNKLEQHKVRWENAGHRVHLPHLDTRQDSTGFDICTQNLRAIQHADEVHIFFEPESKGSHFDMGMAWALGKPIRVIESVEYDGKSYAQLLDHWSSLYQ